FARLAPTWPASCTSTTLRRSPRKKKSERSRLPPKRRAKKPRVTRHALRNPQPPPLPPNQRIDHLLSTVLTLTLPASSFTFKWGCARQSCASLHNRHWN